VAARTAIRSWEDLAPLVEELKEFVVKEWIKYAWVRYLIAAELRPLEEADEISYAPLDPGRLPGRAFGEYYYESPGKYRATLEVGASGSLLVVRQAAGEWALQADLSRVGDLVWAAAVFYELGLGAEPFEGLARAAEAAGVPEVARALEGAARLYRAAEPYMAAEYAAGPGDPPEWFREYMASRVVPVVEEAVDKLAEGHTAEAMEMEVLRDIAPPGQQVRVERVFSPFGTPLRIEHIVSHFRWRGMFLKDYRHSLEVYKRVRAENAALRVARELGLEGGPAPRTPRAVQAVFLNCSQRGGRS